MITTNGRPTLFSELLVFSLNLEFPPSLHIIPVFSPGQKTRKGKDILVRSVAFVHVSSQQHKYASIKTERVETLPYVAAGDIRRLTLGTHRRYALF
jgi:hypothetical protein